MKITWIIMVSMLCGAVNGQSEGNGFSISQDQYFGQRPPGASPELFAPGLVSTGLQESNITFTPDGKECYWSVLFAGFSTILTSRWENGQWTKPEVAAFSGQYYDGWPSIQPDGKRLYFHSGRPVPIGTSGIMADYNIWYIEKTETGWSEPKIVGLPVNGSENATCPSLTGDGTICFSKRLPDSTEQICLSRLVNGIYQEPEILPKAVNAGKFNFHGTISPDGRYLIRPISGINDESGGNWNYYVSFRGSDGQWSNLINLGKDVNAILCGGSVSFSPDGKYLFIQGITPLKNILSRDRTYSLRELIELDLNNTNGSSDIYWIGTDFIDTLKPKELK